MARRSQDDLRAEPPPAPAAPPPARRDGMPPWLPRAALVCLLVAAGLLLVWWLLLRLRGLLVILLVAVFLAIAIEPAVNALARRGWRRGLATWAVFSALFLFAAVFVVAIGTLVVGQSAGLVDAAPGYVQRGTAFLNDHFGTKLSTSQLTSELTRAGSPVRNAATALAGSALGVGATVVGLLFKGLTVLLFTFYLAADGPRLRRGVCSLLPPARQRAVLRAWDLAVEQTGGYVYSRALLATVSAVATTLFLFAIRVPYPLPLGIWVGLVSQFVPTVGTYLAGLLPVLVALLSDPLDAVWTIVFLAAYQQVENYLLAPRITARTMSLHPAVAFGSVIAGAAILGAVGALLALPAAATIQALVGAYLHRYEPIEAAVAGPPARAPAPSLRERLRRRRTAPR